MLKYIFFMIKSFVLSIVHILFHFMSQNIKIICNPKFKFCLQVEYFTMKV